MRALAAGGIPIAMFAGAIFASLLGTIYTAAADGEDEPISLRFVSVVSPEAPTRPAMPATEPAMPAGHEVPDTIGAMLDAEREVMVDPVSGMRIGPLTLVKPPEPEPTSSERPRARRQGSATRPTPNPVRLHPNPGVNVIMTARAMNARGEAINGSCYRYISEVFARAGHTGWRTRRVVHQGNRNGPYADLGLVRPGDWLYIVNHPERTPVGTHSVIFVGWEDRARGIARVIEHPGWGAATTGRERTYGVSRTYRITRPVNAR